MRWFFLILAALLLLASVCVADVMPPYSDVKSDMIKAVYQQMSEKGIVADSNVDWVVGRIRAVYPKLGNVYVVAGNSVWISPGEIFLGTELVGKASNGAIAGMVLCGMYLIEDGGMEARYNKAAAPINSFANHSKDNQNIKIFQDIAIKVTDYFDRDILVKADISACRALPELGYSADEYVKLLKSLSGNGGKLEKILSDLPDRISALDKAGPWAEVKVPAPKSAGEERDQNLRKDLKVTDRITEINPSPYVPVVTGGTIEGYSYTKIGKDVYLLFNRGGKVNKKSKGGFLGNYVFGNGEPSKMESYYINDGKKNQATEAVLLIMNPVENRPFFVMVRLGTDVGMANVPKEYSDLDATYPEAHGDWPAKNFLALRMKVDDIKSQAEFQLMLFFFKQVGDEIGQFTSTDNSRRPQYVVIQCLLAK